MSSIITTKRKRTAIAPTYTIINKSEINSISKRNNKKADNRKTNTKKKTECTGF
jgi:hypothetical protein